MTCIAVVAVGSCGRERPVLPDGANSLRLWAVDTSNVGGGGWTAVEGATIRVSSTSFVFAEEYMTGPDGWALLEGLPAATAMGIHLAAVSAVLAGAVFGDHCSPISDTTIMSSLASGSDHIDHVRTQLPYAAMVGAVALVCGYLPAGWGAPPWLSLLGGAVLVTGFILLVGRRPAEAVHGGTAP